MGKHNGHKITERKKCVCVGGGGGEDVGNTQM